MVKNLKDGKSITNVLCLPNNDNFMFPDRKEKLICVWQAVDGRTLKKTDEPGNIKLV